MKEGELEIHALFYKRKKARKIIYDFIKKTHIKSCEKWLMFGSIFKLQGNYYELKKIALIFNENGFRMEVE